MATFTFTRSISSESRNEWDGVVRPCYRLPGHATMVLEEGERGQVQSYASATETSKKVLRIIVLQQFQQLFNGRWHSMMAVLCAGRVALRLPAMQCRTVLERSVRLAHGNLAAAGENGPNISKSEACKPPHLRIPKNYLH